MTLDKILQAYKRIEERGDVYRLLNDLDIHLFYQDMKVAGSIFMMDGYVSIFIQYNLIQKEFYILHEVGHYLLHQDISLQLYGSSKAEYEANLFACVYLLYGDIYDRYYENILQSNGVPSNIISRYRDMIYQYIQVERYGIDWLRLEC